MQKSIVYSRVPRILDEQHVEVSFAAKEGRDEIIPCIIGRDIHLKYALVQRFCFRKPSDEMLDLMMLAAAVAFCDRTITRHHSLGWSRNIFLTMPVKNPALWNSKAVSEGLVDVLSFLTFDKWTFDFVKRNEAYEIKDHELNVEEAKPHLVIPFSNGLDSLSLVAHLEHSAPDTKLILASAWNHSQAGSPRKWVESPNGRLQKHLRIRFPIQIKGKKPEGTYRTRAFLFSVLAAVTALLTNTHRVAIPENGQGLLGASMIAFGEEAPYRNMHPAFTHKLSNLIYLILGERISFEHPFLWKTKGGILKELIENDAGFEWKDTSSCSRDSRHSSHKGAKIHCGICSNCLLRRVALHAAGIKNNEGYLWPNLDKKKFEDSCVSKDKNPASYRGGAVAGVLLMESLARAANLPATHPLYRKAALEIANNDSSKIMSISKQLSQLTLNHKSEWSGFLDSLSAESWLHEYIRCLQ